MNSALSDVPVGRRRQLAATLGLFAVLFVTVGIVALTGTTPGVVRLFSAISLCVAAVLALAGWGIAHSVKIDVAENRVDAAIEAAIAEHGGIDIACGCGHDHNPDEMHVAAADADGACAHDGTGTDCTHSCDTCLFAQMRPSPTTPRSERSAR